MTWDVLLAWQHGGNMGHAGRLLALASTLRARGRSVAFVVSDADAARRLLMPAGFTCIAAPAPPSVQAGEAPVVNHAEILLQCGFGAPTELALQAVRAWQDLYARLQPQAVVADAAPLGLYAARALGIRALALGHGFELPPASGERPVFAPWLPDAATRGAQAEARLQEGMEALAAALGQGSAPGSLSALLHPQGAALCTWRELDHLERSVPDEDYLGPLWSSTGTATHRFRDCPGSKVLAYLNLVDKRHDLLWQALVEQGANVTVLSPGGSAWAHEAARGWGVDVVDHAVSLESLLAEADAVVSHGGMALCSMGLLAAKPLLLVPSNTEQAILAYRLSARKLAGATVRLRHRANVRERVTALLHPDAAGVAARSALAQKYKGYSPAIAAERVAEKLLA